MTYVQAKLERGNSQMTSWIEKKKGVTVGARVELKETGEFWTIIRLFKEMPAEQLSEQQRMNKSFGLSIR